MPIYLFSIPDGYGHCNVDLGRIVPSDVAGKYRIKAWTGEEIKYSDIEQLMNFSIEEIETIEAPGSARDFIEGVTVGLAIVSFLCGGC